MSKGDSPPERLPAALALTTGPGRRRGGSPGRRKAACPAARGRPPERGCANRSGDSRPAGPGGGATGPGRQRPTESPREVPAAEIRAGTGPPPRPAETPRPRGAEPPGPAEGSPALALSFRAAPLPGPTERAAAARLPARHGSAVRSLPPSADVALAPLLAPRGGAGGCAEPAPGLAATAPPPGPRSGGCGGPAPLPAAEPCPGLAAFLRSARPGLHTVPRSPPATLLWGQPLAWLIHPVYTHSSNQITRFPLPIGAKRLSAPLTCQALAATSSSPAVIDSSRSTYAGSPGAAFGSFAPTRCICCVTLFT